MDLNVLENAASHLTSQDPAAAEALYRQAIARDPGEEHWYQRLAHTLMQQERPLEAITALEGALERSPSASTSLNLCLQLLDAVVVSKQWDWVAELAPRILADNEEVGAGWNYGNAIHQAHIALGWAAHARGELAEAAFFLVSAARTPGSPQLNSFGPDRNLAQALLEAGERAAVREYLEACRAFWENGSERLDEAIAAIDRGDAKLP